MARTVSVVLAAFSEQRWAALQGAIASLRSQTVAADEIVLVIDNNPALLDRAREAFPDVVVVPNASARGASGARNTGAAAATGQVLAFLDDDVVADPRWLELLVRQLDAPGTAGVGGSLVPLWEGRGRRPAWWPEEFDWVIGTSYRGMPERPQPIRNVWSSNMALRREIFEAIGGFRVGFGKTGDRSRPEDTDLCIRAAAAAHGAWWYEPAAVAAHRVPPQRQTKRFFLSRCYHEGRGKAELARLNGAGTSTSTERSYVVRALPRGIVQGLTAPLRGDLRGPLRAGAIISGLASAALGLLVGVAAGLLRRPATAPDAWGVADRSVAVATVVPARDDQPTSTDIAHAS